jgi:hypothetical protein
VTHRNGATGSVADAAPASKLSRSHGWAAQSRSPGQHSSTSRPNVSVGSNYAKASGNVRGWSLPFANLAKPTPSMTAAVACRRHNLTTATLAAVPSATLTPAAAALTACALATAAASQRCTSMFDTHLELQVLLAVIAVQPFNVHHAVLCQLCASKQSAAHTHGVLVHQDTLVPWHLCSSRWQIASWQCFQHLDRATNVFQVLLCRAQKYAPVEHSWVSSKRTAAWVLVLLQRAYMTYEQGHKHGACRAVRLDCC